MQFRQFTGELLKRKSALETQFPPGSLEEMLLANPSESTAEPVRNMLAQVAQMRGVLLGLLEQQAQRMQTIGGSQSYSLFREAEYVMAVLADELMLNAVWVGRSSWRLMEQDIFGSHAAGEVFFQRLDRLLAPPVLASNELAMVYFQALALDFRGRFRGHDPQKQLVRYRRQLYQRLFLHGPEEDAKTHLFPLSYQHESEEQTRQFSNTRLWWFVLAGVVTLWLLVSSVLWIQISDPIDTQTRRIDKIASSPISRGTP